MKSKVLKILIILITILLLTSICYNVLASTVTSQFTGKIDEGAKAGKTKITEILALGLDIVRNVGAGIAVIIIIVIGIKYIIASAGERADIKKHAVPYVIGAVVLFASSGIATILKNFALEAVDTGTAKP